MRSLLRFLLFYKPSRAASIIACLITFLVMVFVTQYRMKGRIDLAKMVDTGSEMQPFWQRNPRLQFVDSFPNTSFVMVKDSQTGVSAMLDSAVVINAEVHPRACDGEGAPRSAIPPGATGRACFRIVKPDTGAGDAYTGAVSFRLREKDAQVAQFYRALFLSAGDKITTIRDSSRGIVLEAEDTRGNTVARIAIRSSFDTATAFLAWTPEFQLSSDPPASK